MYEVIDISGYLVYTIGDVLINTVPEKHQDELINRLSNIKYIILLSSEPDVSGALGRVLDKFPEATVVASNGSIRNIREILNRDFVWRSVKDNEQFSGLVFKLIPGFFWPDSMVVYYEKEKVLFSGNMFSSYDNGDMRLFCQKNIEEIYFDYANEVLNYLDIKKVLPNRGEARDFCEVGDLYTTQQKKENYVAVVYSSIYGYTREMAQIAAECAKERFNVRIICADDEDASSVINNSIALMIGTPTINRAMPEGIKKALILSDQTKLTKKPCMVFGSYGWSGEAQSAVHSILRAMRADMFEKPFRSPLRLSEERKAEFLKFVNRFLDELEIE